MKTGIKSLQILLAASLLLAACSSSPGGTNQDDGQDFSTSAKLTFSSSEPLNGAYPIANMLRLMNSLRQQAAVKSGKDSVGLLVDAASIKEGKRQSSSVSDYDMNYMLIVTPLALDSALQKSSHYEKDKTSLHDLDFNTYVVFIISHAPSAEKIIYGDKLEHMGTLGRTSFFSIFSHPVSIGSQDITQSKWQNVVFALKRRNADTIALINKQDTTFYPIKL